MQRAESRSLDRLRGTQKRRARSSSVPSRRNTKKQRRETMPPDDGTGTTNNTAQAARLHGIAMASMTILKESLQLLSDTTVEGFKESIEAHRIVVEHFEAVALRECSRELPPVGSDRDAFAKLSRQKKDEIIDLAAEKAGQVFANLDEEEAESQIIDPAYIKQNFKPQYETQKIQEVLDEDFAMQDHGSAEIGRPPNVQSFKTRKAKDKGKNKNKYESREAAVDIEKPGPPTESRGRKKEKMIAERRKVEKYLDLQSGTTGDHSPDEQGDETEGSLRDFIKHSDSSDDSSEDRE